MVCGKILDGNYIDILENPTRENQMYFIMKINDYNKSILENEDRYNACLSYITERIDWCIRQIYKSSTDSP